MRPTDKIDNLIKTLKTSASPQLDERIDALIAQSESKGRNRLRQWSIFMRNPITKYAAAAMVFIAVIVGMTLIPGTNSPLALASVIETLKNATCISYDFKVGEDTPAMHDTVYGNIIRRDVMGAVAMIDLKEKRIMTLVEEGKQAILIGFDGLPQMPKNYVNHLIHLLETLQDNEGLEVVHLGPETTDGRELIRYAVNHGSTEVELWIDAETGLPDTIIERQPGLEVICENFDFDVEYTPEMFSMEPPEGYAVVDSQTMFDFKKDGTEENFIFMLQVLANLRDGWFPQDVSIEAYMNQAVEIGHLIEAKYEGTMKQMQVGMSMGKGLIFLRFYKGHGPWYYAGNGVKLGEGDTPIFWYQPKKDIPFRVIFGDLHAESVDPNDIDELVASRQGYMNYAYQIWDKPEIEGAQVDNLHLKKGNMVEIRSKINILRGPMFMPSVKIDLPYENATLLSATLGDEVGLPYEKDGNAGYRFTPDGQLLANGAHMINLIWEFPLENLATAEDGYRIGLQSLIPVGSYELHTTLEPDCGWKHIGHEERQFNSFSRNGGSVTTEFGSCGIPIEPE